MKYPLENFRSETTPFLNRATIIGIETDTDKSFEKRFIFDGDIGEFLVPLGRNIDTFIRGRIFLAWHPFYTAPSGEGELLTGDPFPLRTNHSDKPGATGLIDPKILRGSEQIVNPDWESAYWEYGFNFASGFTLIVSGFVQDEGYGGLCRNVMQLHTFSGVSLTRIERP